MLAALMKDVSPISQIDKSDNKMQLHIVISKKNLPAAQKHLAKKISING